jgi:hypothetical protein
MADIGQPADLAENPHIGPQPPAGPGNAAIPPAYNAGHFPIPPGQLPPGFIPAQFNPPAGGNPAPQPQNVVHQYPQPRSMPSRFSTSAPKFDGHPRSLQRFFEEIELLGRECNLDQRALIRHTLRYLDSVDYDAWNSRPSAAGVDWINFKEEITSMYPGAEDDTRFNVTDLELFVERHASNPMRDRFQFGEYYRNFLTRASWLLNRNLISHRERNKFFMNGFHIDFRHQLRTQLRLQDPTHPLDEPWDINEVEQAARFLLDGRNTGNVLTVSASPSPPPQPYYTAPSSHFAPSPRETFDMASIEQILTSDAFLNRLAGKIHLPASQSSQSSHQPPLQQNQRRTWPCGFCSDPDHMFRHCQTLEDYIRRGLCIRDASYRICMPDNTLVSPQVAPGRNMKERIDNWHKSRSPPVVQAQANILEVVSYQQPASTLPNAPPTPPMSYSSSYVSQDEQELATLEAVALATMKRQEEVCKRIGAAGKSKNSPPAPKRSPNTPNSSQTASANSPSQPPSQSIPPLKPTSNNIPPTSQQQQYRFSSAIEDPKAVQNVMERSLDGTVTLTQRELYAIAPEVRKRIKEQVTTHRIPTGTPATSSLIEESLPDDENPSSSFLHHHLSSQTNPIIVANHTEELRTIPLELDGKVTVDAILDEGSQIIGIRRDIWEKLGLPLLRDLTIVMESANATKESTMGLLRDLPVRIGSSTFYLQVQVIENAPYEMLLGRPFLTLTQAQTHHYSNGDSHITLIDPNTNETITIPTMTRVRKPVQSSSGF